MEENVIFQLAVSENKGIFFSLSKYTIPEFDAWTPKVRVPVLWCVHTLKRNVCACICVHGGVVCVHLYVCIKHITEGVKG